MSGQIQIMTTEQLAGRIFDHEDMESFSDWIDPETAKAVDPGKFVVCIWGDNCQTAQHLGDAAIHGPFDTRQEAETYR